MKGSGAGARRAGGLGIALFALSIAVVAPGKVPARADDPRPNIIVILTDDQSLGTLPAPVPAMPYLQARIADPDGGWRWFPNAFVQTPLCCPSRATILTGLTSRHTGVQNNGQGDRLDESQTLPVWLHAAGYTTALVGKYLNRYPFERGPYVPPGWDRFLGKENVSSSTVYANYPFIDQGVPLQAGSTQVDYATDALAGAAVHFVESAPRDRPYFLLFAPSAPHAPWVPAPRDVGSFSDLRLDRPPSFGVTEPGDPAWIRGLPPIGASEAAALDRDRIRERETLLAVDDAVRSIVEAVTAAGDLDRTVIFFLTDNGYSYGEHRWVGKQCPYLECVRTPFAVHVPGATAGSDPTLVSNLDLAPTIAALAGTRPGIAVDGADLAPLLTGTGPPPTRPAIFTEFHGDRSVPGWTAVQTADLVFVRIAGQELLYDLTGRFGPPDPWELDNRAGDPRYASVRDRLSALLTSMATQPPGHG